jgi:hypothetical protein
MKAALITWTTDPDVTIHPSLAARGTLMRILSATVFTCRKTKQLFGVIELFKPFTWISMFSV